MKPTRNFIATNYIIRKFNRFSQEKKRKKNFEKEKKKNFFVTFVEGEEKVIGEKTRKKLEAKNRLYLKGEREWL